MGSLCLAVGGKQGIDCCRHFFRLYTDMHNTQYTDRHTKVTKFGTHSITMRAQPPLPQLPPACGKISCSNTTTTNKRRQFTYTRSVPWIRGPSFAQQRHEGSMKREGRSFFQQNFRTEVLKSYLIQEEPVGFTLKEDVTKQQLINSDRCNHVCHK